MGDPSGIGPEVCLAAAADPRIQTCVQTILIGDGRTFRRVSDICGLALPDSVRSLDDAIRQLNAGARSIVLEIEAVAGTEVQPGTVSADTGMASYRYIEAAIDAALAGTVDAVTTGPIHKEALYAAGIKFPGHTEIFAARTSSDRACMMLTSSELTCAFVTTHVGYRDVPGLLSEQRILDVIELSYDAMVRARGEDPRLVICGLNPHAGEHGLFGGQEEERFIIPAVQQARQRGINIEGPLPPDTAFLPQRRKSTDCFICMYHDQGHIPLKVLAFDMAVNTTLGLPIIRTSVDHGTALDIAWQGKADANSMIEALLLAQKLSTDAFSANGPKTRSEVAL